MKVLFAVNSESISDAIIKKYQKDYREILSYKNVYYFNAILKEIQKDKTYDRIVISEDLEQFTNNNYESIDKFIFEKLDGISDEAHDVQGNEISIILICSDRHTKGSSFLVKLFGIGVYNALLGNDRSMEEVCRLIKKPRTKKEAKMYYKIDTDDVNYRAENENEVSELEIQNIISHFKKLGKNTAKYASSFDNIASQYTEEQLKIIINCLPMNVKATLEENSAKYQEIMSVNGGMVKGIKSTNTATREAQKRTGIKIDIIENKMNQQKMDQPIVIPNSVKSTRSATAKKVVAIPQNQEQEAAMKNKKVRPEIADSATEILNGEKKKKKLPDNVKIVKKRMPDGSVKLVKVVKKAPAVEQVKQEENILPDLDANVLPNLEENNISENENQEVAPKRKRGRPRKKVVEEAPKPKGKRGRPRKKVVQEPEIEEDDDLSQIAQIDEQLDINTFENEELSNDVDEINLVEDSEVEPVAEAIDLPELDELDDLDDEFSDTITEESFDEFNDYDEYGEYEAKTSLKPEETVDELYQEDILSDDTEDLLDVDNFDDDLIDEDIVENTEILDTDDLESDLLDSDESDDLLSDLDDTEDLLSAVGEDEDDDSGLLLGLEDDNQEDVTDFSDTLDESDYGEESLQSIESPIDYSMSNLSSLMTKDNKVVAFLGSPKNGVSFLVNNLAEYFASVGRNTAILDMTKNKNSYYIYTQNEEALRKVAYTSIENLQNGVANGIKVKNNLTVYTALPNDGKDYSNAEPILSTLVQNHSIVLIDCDFDTNPSYFANCQEIYLVQSMDILTIQPLTAFLRELKTQGVLEPEKVRVVINKELKVKGLSNKAIIGGMSFYNDPAMSFMTELFNKDTVTYCSIPFEEMIYSKYLGDIVDCKVSISGYSKNFIGKLRILGDMVYPVTSSRSI